MERWLYALPDGLDTMLKTRDGDAYVFSMVDGESRPGARTFQLPDGVDGRSAEVLFEDRSVAISPEGVFTDDFAEEFTYHIYRIALDG